MAKVAHPYKTTKHYAQNTPKVYLVQYMNIIECECQKIFSSPRVVPWFPLLGLTPSGLFMGSISTSIYTSESILCFTITYQLDYSANLKP